MKVELWYIGKTSEKYLQNGISIYTKRLKHYCNFTEVCIKDVKGGMSSDELKQKEAESVIGKLSADDYLILLDEKGKRLSSEKLASHIEKLQLHSTKKVIFLVAGAFGAHETLKNRAQLMLSLSDMTFSHQMIRLFIVEQIYRAFTIIKNEKYHNS